LSLIEVSDLQMYYASPTGDVRAVDGVSFALEKGEALGIVGESGSGKTSLSLALMQLTPRNATTIQGTISLEGEDLTAMSAEEFRLNIRWKRMSMVFQAAMNSLNPVIRVGDQVRETLALLPGSSKTQIDNKVLELFDLVGLSSDTTARFPHELSGGMRQRVMIAMALVMDPDLVILDEPTSALDVSIQAQIMNLLKDLKRDLGTAFIFVTHDIALASDLCDKIAVMYAGKIAEIGPATDVLTNPRHPYTNQLLGSIPGLYSKTAPVFVAGTPPDLVNPITGCQFRLRCEFALERCSNEIPPYFKLSKYHEANCWMLEGAS